MIIRKGAVRVHILPSRNIGISLVHENYPNPRPAEFAIERADLADLVDCLSVVDGRKGSPAWIASQLGVAIEEGFTLEQIDVRPPVRFDGVFTRCPRGGTCVHEHLCPGSIR